jgi:ABC-type multidrug transport system ATPase subunit
MLDRPGRADVLAVLDALRGAGRAVLHVTHHVADAARADRVVVMDRGAVAYTGSAAELLRLPRNLEELGLELPGLWRLGEHLRAAGLDVPAAALDPASVVDALWR